MVEDYQHEAKKNFALGKCMYSKAYSQFKKAAFHAERLPKTEANIHLLATLYGNCSLIQMKKENYRTCIADCDKALALEVLLTIYELNNSQGIRRCYIEKQNPLLD